MNLKIEEIESILRANAIPASTIVKIVNELEAVVEDKKEDTDTGPKQKNKFVVIQNDKDSAWVVQIPDADDAGTVESRLKAASKDFNTNSKKGKKNPIKSWLELFAALPRKFTKEPSVNVLIKSKNLVRVITPSGQP